ncbi:hypothetical protein Forpi1262_v015182 [Fusarium oxysporum f. sp. raphani]|uniref:AC transposase n=1 Tax=Fusarium oxysporum f. sp. raphani TaxID=96318 RepID=A0A8J5PCG7_FUSOX|nr:hypothetical protein Forpi1262_v016602 [Fusarium oxysporum f. sp. raphani]KAG7423533.1 hypothetical protein Forpi1262_v015182 [Fusarium oxysporum f. sp. raphani]
MLVELIVSSNQSFSFAENPILREIFGYLNPSVSIQHANLSATAVRYKIIQEYNRHKQKVIEVLRDSPGALHISFDGWTSRNKLALYGIACFFRDEKNRPCKIMIGVPEAHRHFGSTIGGEVLDVLHTLGVSPEKIGYFTLDNAANNDTAMEVIGAELGFDGRLRRGRCFGHTINLSAKALLFGKNADAFEQQLSGAEALSDTEYARWRKRGPVGKLHNIVVDVRISHRLIYLFKEVQRDEINRATTLKLRSKKPLKLIIDNDTRWLSQLYMIRRALRLKTSIELLLIKYKAQWEDENRSKKTGQVTQAKLAKKPRILRDENQLTDKDWEVLYHLEAILTVFETVVKTLEGDGHIRRRKQGWTGSYGNIWDVVLGYELLLNTLEEYKQLAADFPDPEHFRIGINLAWDKLDEYYRRLDETPIYYTAMALHPAYRWDWFDETWAHKPSWVEKAKEMVADVWLSDYAHLEVRTSSSRGDDEPPAKRPRFFNPFEKNSRLPSSIPPYAAAIVVDEYQAWQTDREASDGNDGLGLPDDPADVSECERLFSAAGKMVSGLRTNLDAEIIAICQVLRSWYRAGLIKDLDPLLKSHLETRRIRCFGHVLHLVATAMLFVHDTQALEDLDLDDFDEWTKRGPVGKLHNLVVWINRSNKATVILRRLQDDDPDKNYPGTLDVVLDNCTRWLSQYYMIERAIKLRRYLEELVDITIQTNRKLARSRSKVEKSRSSLPSCLEEDNLLTDADWEALNWFSNILAMFNSCLLRLEGDCQVRLRKGGAEAQYGMVWQVAIAYEFLLSTLERAKTESADRPESSYLSACINSARAKLNKYYTKLDETRFITQLLGREGWIDKARYLIQTLWEEEYRDLPAQWEIADSNLPVAVRAREYNPFDSFQDELMSYPNSEEESVADEFERWQSTKQDTFSKHDNPLEYWSAKRFEYPRVAKMAIDVLSNGCRM